MKRRIIIFSIIVILITYPAFSQEDLMDDIIDNIDYEPYDYVFFGTRVSFEIGLRVIFNDSFGLSFLNFGIGLGKDLIPHVLSPGISFDIGIGPGWFTLFSDKDDDNSSSNNKDSSESSFFHYGLSGGIRLYNIIHISQINIVPFVGCNFLFFFIPSPNIGVSVSFNIFAIEYAYYIGNVHHIGLKITANRILNSF